MPQYIFSLKVAYRNVSASPHRLLKITKHSNVKQFKLTTICKLAHSTAYY